MEHFFLYFQLFLLGDVGKEMFIVTIGQVQVVGGPDDSIVFVTLGEGRTIC